MDRSRGSEGDLCLGNLSCSLWNEGLLDPSPPPPAPLWAAAEAVSILHHSCGACIVVSHADYWLWWSLWEIFASLWSSLGRRCLRSLFLVSWLLWEKVDSFLGRGLSGGPNGKPVGLERVHGAHSGLSLLCSPLQTWTVQAGVNQRLALECGEQAALVTSHVNFMCEHFRLVSLVGCVFPFLVGQF